MAPNPAKPCAAVRTDKDPGVSAPVKLPGTTKDFMLFMLHRIIERKKWFLLPLWALLLAIAAVLLLSGNVHLLPAIYIAF